MLQSDCGRCSSSAQLCSIFAIALLPQAVAPEPVILREKKIINNNVKNTGV
jgi:hypothetical protein